MIINLILFCFVLFCCIYNTLYKILLKYHGAGSILSEKILSFEKKNSGPKLIRVVCDKYIEIEYCKRFAMFATFDENMIKL